MTREMMPVLQVVFSHSAAGTLRRALEEDGRSDQVACLDDNFSFGPINGDPDARVQWMDDELGIDDWDEVVASVPQFLELSCSPDVLPVAWISRRDTLSYAGFLWWLSHLGDGPCKVVDVTDMTLPGPEGPRFVSSSAMLNHEQVLEIIDSHVPLEEAERARHRQLWRQLVSENAPLRVIDQTLTLISAPISHFDPLLLAHATTEWRKMSLMIGWTLASFMDDGIFQTGDLILCTRARELAETGALEWRGDLTSIHQCEVRLPAGANAIAS